MIALLAEIHGQVDQVLLAIPSLPRSERRRIVAELQCQAIPVLQIPSVDDLTSGRARIDALRPVAIEDLLGRDPVPPVPELLGPGLRDAVVCVTGAGGSIGSELCVSSTRSGTSQLASATPPSSITQVTYLKEPSGPSIAKPA